MGVLFSTKNSSRYDEKKKFLLERNVDRYFVEGMSEWAADLHHRLDKIMVGDNDSIDIERTDGDSFEVVNHGVSSPNYFLPQFCEFVKRYSDWRGDNAVLFWRHFEEKYHSQILVTRKQMSGLCFMHAPVVLQHYLLSIYRIAQKQELDFKMIDVAVFIRDHWKGNDLQSYIANDIGGSSVEFFRHINYPVEIKFRRHTLNNPKHKLAFKKVCSDILEELKAGYPGLISNFKVSKEFLTSGTSFRGLINLSTCYEGIHAMLLIGTRKTDDDEYFFLLQNWWEGRFFVEVSADYLYSSEATISFVEEDIREIPTAFACTNSPYSETATDVRERF